MRVPWLSPAALLLAAAAVAAQPPDAADIVRRSVEQDRLNFERANNYSYIQQTVQRRLGKDGRVWKTESRTFDVMVIDGELYEKLIAKDGKPLSVAEARKEQEKLDRELARRRGEDPHKRSRRLRDLEKRRREGRQFAGEIPDAFEFRLVGEERLEGRPVWVLDAEPRSGYVPRAKRAALLTRFRGRLWIDQQDYQWVRVEAETIAPVSFGWILARLAPGARLTFEQRRVHDEVWLPSRAWMRLGARLALLMKVRAEIEVCWRDYRKFQSDTRITGFSEAQPEQ